MLKFFSYSIAEVEPYINWLYFFHSWQMNGKPEQDRENLRREASALLSEMAVNGKTHAVFGLFDANSDGDDLLVGDCRLPMLRQQVPSAEGHPCLCLADFVRPLSSGIKDKVGVFATTVDNDLEQRWKDDVYYGLLAQTLCDRLAEATAEKLHEEVRRHEWGYAPDENLSISELFHCDYQGIRPAIGYPSLPDTSVNFILSDILQMERIGIKLTESAMMIPHASVSGFMLSHPQARYFNLGEIGEDQLCDYARRRGLHVDAIRRFLSPFCEKDL